MVKDLLIRKDMDLIGHYFFRMFSCASKEEEVSETPNGFNMVLSEEDVKTVIEIEFMVPAMSQQSRDDIEEELCLMDGD